jgi:type I restriction enzyme S subunit
LSIDIFQFANATTAPSIRKSDIEEHEVFFPKRNVQKQIVEMLDKSELLKTRRRLSNEETDKLIQSIFYTMFGDPITNDRKWNTDTLGNICGEFQNGIGKNKEFYGKGTKVANIGDLYDWCKFRPLKYSLLEVSDEEIKTYCLKKGDLVFVRSSVKKEGVAYCSAYDSEEECLFSSFMIRTHPKKIVNSVWLSFCLRIKEMHDYLVRMSNTGTITNISQPLLKSIKIIVPPTDIQEKFVSIVEMVESIREHQKKSTKDINQLFDALMQKAFAGDLIVE